MASFEKSIGSLLPPPSSNHSSHALLLVLLATTITTTISLLLLLPSSPTTPLSRPLSLLSRPTVILISLDGFRYNYHLKPPSASVPNLLRLISSGTEAIPGLIPVFPTLTFPNHYSIATGLFPSSHGIVSNVFLDPASGQAFSKSRHEPFWWLGEPLWATVARHGLPAAAYFWAGSEVKNGAWTCPPRFCPPYNMSVPFHQRVDDILTYFDLPSDEVPVFVALYFDEPDTTGHRVGPDDPKIIDAVQVLDEMLGRLIQGLEKRGIFEDVNLILLGDHGMLATCDQKQIFLDDLSPWITIPSAWVDCYSPVLAIRPPANISAEDVVARMNEGLRSGKVENWRHLKVFLKEDLPARLHYSGSDRISPVIGIVDEGYKLKQKRTGERECGGDHGYDNALFSMRSIFVARGPRFAWGRKIPSFQNIEVYNLVTAILGLEGAPNNGSASFPASVLLLET